MLVLHARKDGTQDIRHANSTLSAELLYKNKSSPQRKHGNGGHGLKRNIVLKSDLIKLLQKNIIFELSERKCYASMRSRV